MQRCILMLCATVAFCQEGFYQLAIDQDQLGGAVDFSWLNRPLGPADRLVVRDGHFTRIGEDLQPGTSDDERIRLFGMNLAFKANFPEADAGRIAKRLRKLGVNIVRLHHLDSQPDRDPNNAGSLLTTGPYPTVNEVAAGRLRVFLDALKAEGIYVNLNLHVGYQFRPAVDGVPALPEFPTQSKPLHIFYPAMVEKQAEYTRKVIDALGLADDPVLAMVEIDNESSLLQAWQTGNLDRWLQGEYRDELQQQWNSYLRAGYGSTEKLRAAWGASEPDGPDLLPELWRLEIHSPSQASYNVAIEGGLPAAAVTVARGGAPVILKKVGFSVAVGQLYIADVEMRADLPEGASRIVYWDIKQDVSPWRTAIGRNVTVTNQWQKYRMLVSPSFAMEGIGRFGLSVERVESTVYVRNYSLRPAGRRGLGAGESLEAGNVSLVAEDETATEPRTNDYLLFLADRDRDYLRVMARAVRESMAWNVAIAGTQMGYGGLPNLDSHADLDYDDNHFYVDHYNFPNVAWDGRDWRIRDSSSLGSGLDAFRNMAIARQVGRPYTVSEYNQPWPNTYAAEIDPTLAVFGAFQDWDSIMHFAYSHGRGWDDGVPNGFNVNGDWTKFPNIGQAAWLFRADAIRSGVEPIDIPVSKELRLRAGRERRNSGIGGFLQTALGYNPDNALIHMVRLVKDGAGPAPEAAGRAPAAPFLADTGEFTYDRDRKLFLIHSPKAAGVFGFLGQKNPVTGGAIDVELAGSARGFAAVLLTPCDQRPLEESRHMLLSNPGHTLRSQPGADPPRPQRLVNYGTTTDWWTLEKEPNHPNKPSGDLNGGVRPVWMEQVEAWVTLRTPASGIAVYPLDGAGRRMAPLGAKDIERLAGGFRIHLNAPSPWYEIVAE